MSLPAETLHNQPAVQPTAVVDDKISLAELLGQLWRGKWLIVACVAATLGVAMWHLAVSEPAYRVSYVVSPVEGGGDRGGGGLPSGARQAAEFAGISLPSSDSGMPRIAKYTNALTSLTVARRLAREHDMLPRVFHGKWDSESETWKLVPDGGPLNWVEARIKEVAGIPTAPRQPDARDLKSYIKSNLSIESGEMTSLYTISMTHTRPELAEDLLTKLNTVTDQLLRERALQRTRQYIAYVQDKLPETTLAAHRDSLTRLLLQQERSLMMAQIDGPYAADVFDPITVSTGPVSPKLKLPLVAAVVLGILIGVFAVFLRQALRASSKSGNGGKGAVSAAERSPTAPRDPE